MSYHFFNEESLSSFSKEIVKKTKEYVDNATVASAQKATNDSDGNAISTTYRKVADSYSKTEVDNKVANLPKSITITTDDLIANYTFAQLLNLLESGKTVYLQLTDNDPIYGYSGAKLNIYEYGTLAITWGCQFGADDGVYTVIVTARGTNADSSIPLSYTVFPTNTFTTVSTISIAVSAWNGTSKTATVSVSGVTADNAVDVAPAGSSFDDYVNASIRATAQGNGALTFTCKTIPTKAISVNIKSITTKAEQKGNRNVK